jgi:hypothetical protein
VTESSTARLAVPQAVDYMPDRGTVWSLRERYTAFELVAARDHLHDRGISGGKV